MTIRVKKSLLAYRLKMCGKTQNDLAEYLEVSKQQISKYARGENLMSLQRAKEIAEFCNCTIDELYEWE